MTTADPAIAPVTAPRRRIALPKLSGRSEPDASYSFQDLEFIDPDEFGAGLNRLLLALYRKLGVLIIAPPVLSRRTRWVRLVPLAGLGQVAGFGDERSQRLLRHHQRRTLQRMWTTLIAYLLTVSCMGLLVVQVPLWRIGRDAAWQSVTLSIVFMLLYVLGVLAAMRLSGLIVDRHYAESLCTAASLYLLVDLYREDVLSRPEHRRSLVDRFENLARATKLLALRYSSSEPETRARLQRHFREMVSYVRTRQAWAVTPVATTLDDLRRDIGTLSRIYITGSYGEFTWKAEAPAQADPPASWRRSLPSALGRILGLGAPLVGMVYLLGDPGRLPDGFESQQLGLVFVAWVLLGLDSVLKLGVVSGLTGLAKGIKELK